MAKNKQFGSTNTPKKEFEIIVPELQMAFYLRLQEIKQLYLEEAMANTIKDLDIAKLDKELLKYAGNKKLARLASFGLRGEIFYPVPYLLESNPALLGYYRLLFGLSKKEFYEQGNFGIFKALEEKRKVTEDSKKLLDKLCGSLIETSWILVSHIEEISKNVVRELQLLTVGPQLRGGRNTVLGQQAITIVFKHIKALVSGYIIKESERTIVIENDSKRTVKIMFSSDPDIRIVETLPSGDRNLVAIEIKGGKDISNIHNRLGEAEKSHQKARNKGFHECWTVIAVDVDKQVAQKESPSTNRFFNIEHIENKKHPQYFEFSDQLSSLLSIQIKNNGIEE